VIAKEEKKLVRERGNLLAASDDKDPEKMPTKKKKHCFAVLLQGKKNVTAGK